MFLIKVDGVFLILRHLAEYLKRLDITQPRNEAIVSPRNPESGIIGGGGRDLKETVSPIIPLFTLPPFSHLGSQAAKLRPKLFIHPIVCSSAAAQCILLMFLTDLLELGIGAGKFGMREN